MLTRLRRALAGGRGFTLIELVVVIAILGLLIALALPNYLGARRRAAFAEAREIGQEWRELAWSCYLQTSSMVTCAAGSGGGIGFSETNAVHWAFETGTYNTPATPTSPIIFTVLGRTTSALASGETYLITLNSTGTASDQFTP